jgi:hypothetical protein
MSLRQQRLDFDRLRPQLARALKRSGRGAFEPEDVWEAIAEGRMQFWPAPGSAVVTELRRYPRQLACHVFLAGGVMQEVRALAPVVMAWARTQGATLMTLEGRPGWARSWLGNEGWRTKAIVMERRL